MATHFYFVYVDRKDEVKLDDVEEKMNLAVDWFRINAKTWILYTTSDAQKWYERLKPVVHPGGHTFICRLDVSDRQGWMSEKFWEWLRKPR